jgi:methoxymalonate biosynthesis acyl carrier protein
MIASWISPARTYRKGLRDMKSEDAMRLLREFIRERYNVSAGDADFNDDVHLFDFGYVDSFGAVELFKFVETAFGISISQSELISYPLNTIREISEFIEMRKGGTNAEASN